MDPSNPTDPNDNDGSPQPQPPVVDNPSVDSSVASSSTTPLLHSATPTDYHTDGVTSADSRRTNRAGSRRHSTGNANSENDPLFEGLSRGLSDASAEAQRLQQRQVDDDDDDDDVNGLKVSPPQRGIGGVGSPGSLGSPLISPSPTAAVVSPGGTTIASSSMSTGRRHLNENVLRRHIRLTDGEFEISRHHRSFIMSQKSWFEKKLMGMKEEEIERTDLFRDNYIKSSRYESVIRRSLS